MTEVYMASAIGKRLSKFVSGGRQAVLVFDDGTYTTIGVDVTSDDDDTETTFVAEKFDKWCFTLENLVEIGLKTREEADAEIAKDRAEYEAGKLGRDKAEYERLKAKFESK